MRCKDCKYWKKLTDGSLDRAGNPIGTCTSGKIVYTGAYDTIYSDELGYCDDEGYNASIEVGQDFGCIHFKEK